MVFPVIMFGYENWTIKKAERWRIDAFELWCWRRLLRVPWTARRYNQSILKEISPEYSLEGLMLEPKLQYFGHLMRRTNSFKKIMLGKIRAGGEGDDRGWDGWMASTTRGHEFEWTLGVGDKEAWRAMVHGVAESDSTERLNWTGSATKLGKLGNFSGSHMSSIKGDIYFMAYLL